MMSLFKAWTWRMAWRDSRTSRRRLLLFSSSIILGVAALAAISSFATNVRSTIEEQAKTLVGADLAINSRQRFSEEDETFFKSLGGEQSRQVSFASMVFFPGAQGGTRLVQVRALEGGFPYYGRIETTPPEAAAQFRTNGTALVEESLLIQFNAKVGDEVRLGDYTTRVGGILHKVPGETVLFATLAPRVVVASSVLPATGLLRGGSLAQHRAFFRFPDGTDMAALTRSIVPRLDVNRLSFTTVARRKEELGRSLENLYSFLSLSAFAALLLGSIGVGSAIHTHIRQKLGNVAILRCLGTSSGQAFSIYLVQGMAVGAVGAGVGGLLGLGVQEFLPRVAADLIPFEVQLQTSWSSLIEAMALGFFICLLFAALPLLSVRSVPPMAAIRSSMLAGTRPGIGRSTAVLITLAALAVVGFALLHTPRWRLALGVSAGIGVALGGLALAARALMGMSRRLARPPLPYVWRQGLASLHRPNNRTLITVLTVGLCTFVVLTSVVIRDTLLRQVAAAGDASGANTILFDIQEDQRDAVRALLKEHGMPVIEEAPIITMRLASIKGRSVEEILASRDKSIPRWVLRREYRSTYRASPGSGEKVIAGVWHDKTTPETSPIPVSIEAGIGRDLGVGVGDELSFDLQGIPLAARVASIREVDWRRVQPNFFVVFPPGAIDDAPAFHVMVSRSSTPAASAALQKAVVARFPTISAIDLSLVLQTVDSIMSKVSLAVQFLSAFLAATGLLVLTGAIATGKYQRVRESILLRTLGASRSQIFRILFAEYLALGILASAAGVGLSLMAGWGLARFVFDAPFMVPWAASVLAFGATVGLTTGTGLLLSRGILDQPPLAVLREENLGA